MMKRLDLDLHFNGGYEGDGCCIGFFLCFFLRMSGLLFQSVSSEIVAVAVVAVALVFVCFVLVSEKNDDGKPSAND